MKTTDILAHLGNIKAGHALPKEAFNAAGQQWPAVFTHLSQLIDQFNADPSSLSEQQDNQLFFGVLLMGQHGQPEQLEKLLQLFATNDDIHTPLDTLMGDALTETLPSILYILADGKADLLNAFILGDHPSIFLRSNAIDVIFFQYHNQYLSNEQLISLIDSWLSHFESQQGFAAQYSLSNIAGNCMDYGITQYRSHFIELYKSNKLDPEFISLQEIEQWEPQTPEVLNKKLFKEYNAYQDLSTWPAFKQTAPKTRSNKVGRNDPCPCGSGKKYKKCCLTRAC